ncbi:sigma-70 family RNA polymerase sigma factor [Nakamurella deserti]|uniref:sigma-70 family RNA polymerase sigma factor n=1 Tax=Nakamurella deserti TaxID=2164074 RepID=UPI000DBE35FD|nr:sigma-70 family RNA polymerase sigma factor [Nakamurella deserti]
MTLHIIHSSEADDVDPRSLEAQGGYAESEATVDVEPTGGEHPLAVAVITLCHATDRAAVAELVEDNVSLVEILVSERMRTVPRHVDRDDLMSAGMMALVLSAIAFDADRAVSFRSFAAFRIRGALIDELRGMDWASRSVRARVRAVEAARRDLTVSLSRCPSDTEVAAALGMSLRELDAVQADAARGTVVSLQGFAPEVVHDVLPDRTHGPEALLLHREQLGYLHDAVAALPDRLRRVVEAYYFENRPMGEIAAELSVTQSRVSQMCAEATALMRDGINAQLDPEALAPLARTGRAAATRRAYYQAVGGRHTVAGRLAMSTCQGEIRRRVGAEAAAMAVTGTRGTVGARGAVGSIGTVETVGSRIA